MKPGAGGLGKIEHPKKGKRSAKGRTGCGQSWRGIGVSPAWPPRVHEVGAKLRPYASLLRPWHAVPVLLVGSPGLFARS